MQVTIHDLIGYSTFWNRTDFQMPFVTYWEKFRFLEVSVHDATGNVYINAPK